MCIQRRPTLCMGPMGATHLSSSTYARRAIRRPSGLPQPKELSLDSIVVIGGSGGDVSCNGHTVDGKMVCISFSPPGCSFELETEGKKGRGMEWRNHACFCPPLSVMNNLAVQGPCCRVEMVVMGRLDIYGVAWSSALRWTSPTTNALGRAAGCSHDAFRLH